MIDHIVLAEGLRFPEAPVALADGSILVGELAGSTIACIHPGGRISRRHTGGSPNGLAVGPDGAVYLCNNGGADYRPGHFLPRGPSHDYDGGSIQKVDPQTGKVVTLFTHCGKDRLSAPNDLVFDRQGGFYFTDTGKRFDRHRDHGGIYYCTPAGAIECITFPVLSPNGIGLSPDEATIYVADTETGRLWALDLDAPGRIVRQAFPSPFGGRLLCGLGGFQRFDSLAVTAAGNICVATLVSGKITVVTPQGAVLRQVQMPGDAFPTNLCFGGADMRTAYITLAQTGRLIAMEWDEPGLTLNHAGGAANDILGSSRV